MTTCERSQQTLFDATELPLMSSAAASPARTLASLESALASKVRDLVCGANTGASLASYDRASSSWKTCQACLVSGFQPFSETWPRSGMMRHGTAYQLQPSAPLTDGIVSGLLPMPTPTAKANMMAPSMQKWAAHKNLWPTPAASVTNLTEHPNSWQARANRLKERGINGNGAGMPLTVAVKPWPTPTSSLGTKGGRVTPRKSREGGTLIEAVSARRFRTPTSADARGKSGTMVKGKQMQLVDQVSGSLNPTWVEWLMGFPLGWTVCAAWETRSSRKSRKSSAAPS